jgi:hypothetical protein
MRMAANELVAALRAVPYGPVTTSVQLEAGRATQDDVTGCLRVRVSQKIDTIYLRPA